MNFKYRPCETTRITSPFGPRKNPTGPGKQDHKGIDVSPSDKVKYFQEPIFATADGRVSIASFHKLRGNQVMLDHGAAIQTRSQHLANITVKNGQSVKAGEVIGHMGSTGDSSGQHLHFEVIVNGKCVNPDPYVMHLPMPAQRSENYKKVQAKYAFDDATMTYLASHTYAETLFAKFLLPKGEQAYQVDTINFILKYKYGKEIFERLDI